MLLRSHMDSALGFCVDGPGYCASSHHSLRALKPCLICSNSLRKRQLS